MDDFYTPQSVGGALTLASLFYIYCRPDTTKRVEVIRRTTGQDAALEKKSGDLSAPFQTSVETLNQYRPQSSSSVGPTVSEPNEAVCFSAVSPVDLELLWSVTTHR